MFVIYLIYFKPEVINKGNYDCVCVSMCVCEILESVWVFVYIYFNVCINDEDV